MELNETKKQDLNHIKEHVTHFSIELGTKAVQEQEVTVGGRITHLIPPVSDEHPMYIAMMDDVLGTVHVFAPETLVSAYSEQFQPGNMVFVEGYVNFVTHTEKRKVKKDASVFAFGLKDTTK